MPSEALAPRLRRLPTAELLSREVPVAVGLRARVLGLARLEREEAGAGLLIPRCNSVHTFGMRFALDILFLDIDGEPLSVHLGTSPRRFLSNRRAAAVLEVPS